MITVENFQLFLALSWVLIVTPGPDLIFVLTKGIGGGKKVGLVSAAGVASGILIHTLFAALGLSAILQASSVAFTLVKVVGAGYLIYLGVSGLIKRNQFLIQGQAPISSKKTFWQGFLSNTLNPKVALFFLAFLPQFVDTTSGHGAFTGFLILGLVFGVCTLSFLMLLGYFSGLVGRLLNKNPRAATWLGSVSSIVMILLGIRLLSTKKA